MGAVANFMIITRTSPLTGKTNSLELPVTEIQFKAWEAGVLLQDAFWNLNSDEREFIKTGYTTEDWDKMLPPEEEVTLSSNKEVMFAAIEKHVENSKKQFEQLPTHIQKRLTDNPPIIIDSMPPPSLPKEWESFGEIPVVSNPKPALITARPLTKDDFGEMAAADMDNAPPKEEKQYLPPSSKIYKTSCILYTKFYKVRPVYKYLNNNIFLAGGSLRTVLKCSVEEVNDFDLFFKTLAEVQPLRDRLEKDGFEKYYECPDGFLYSYRKGKHKIQLICKIEYATPEILLQSFDVSPCLFAWHDKTLYFTREAVRSVFRKRLRVNNVTFPVATLKRLVKYAQKGYSVGMGAEDFCRQTNNKSFTGDQFRHYID